MDHLAETFNDKGLPVTAGHGQLGKATLSLLWIAVSLCFFATETPREALAQDTATLPFSYSIGPETHLSPSPDILMDNAWNFQSQGGNLYLTGFDASTFKWKVCQGANLDSLYCHYYATNPALPPPTTSPGWPSLGGDGQGSYWPDGIYADPSGTWYITVHVEFNYNNKQPNSSHFRGIGLATSKDQGHNWLWQGWIVTSSNPTDSPNEYPGMYYDNGPGDDKIVVDTKSGYIYLFYQETWVRKADSVRSETIRVARSPIHSNMAVGTWGKWYDGNWDQPGLGGLASDVFFGNDSAQVSYDSYLSQFIEFGKTGDTDPRGGRSMIATASSLALENWTPQQQLESNFLKWYNQAIDPTHLDEDIIGKSFRVYVSASGGNTKGAEYYPFSLSSGRTTSPIDNIPYPVEPVNDCNPAWRMNDVAQGARTMASSDNGNAPSNATDGDLSTPWIAANGLFPQTLTVDLGASVPLGSVKQVWNERDDSTFAYQILGSNDNVKWTVLADRSDGVTRPPGETQLVAPLAAYVTDDLSGVSADTTLDNVYGSYRYVRLNVTGETNDHWASSAEFSVYLAEDIALGRYGSANSYTTGNPPNSAIDRKLNTAWVASGIPSPSSPQTLTIDLEVPQPLGTIIQRFNDTDNSKYYFSLRGSDDGSKWSTLVDYTGTGIEGPVSVSTVSGAHRYVQLYITRITNGHPASSREFEIYYPSDGPIVSGKSYKIINLNSGLLLDNPGKEGYQAQMDQATDGSTQDCKGTPCSRQIWRAGYLGENEWSFTNDRSGYVLEVLGASTQQGAAIDQGEGGGGSNQAWILESSGVGTYRLRNVKSNMYMDVTRSLTSVGALIHQWPGRDASQEWAFIPTN